MKHSRSRIANAINKAQRRKAGPPKVSKYAAKFRPQAEASKTDKGATNAG